MHRKECAHIVRQARQRSGKIPEVLPRLLPVLGEPGLHVLSISRDESCVGHTQKSLTWYVQTCELYGLSNAAGIARRGCSIGCLRGPGRKEGIDRGRVAWRTARPGASTSQEIATPATHPRHSCRGGTKRRMPRPGKQQGSCIHTLTALREEETQMKHLRLHKTNLAAKKKKKIMDRHRDRALPSRAKY